MSDQANVTVLTPGVPTDAYQLAALSRDVLPSFTHLHDATTWEHRFGEGDQPGRPGLWVLRRLSEGSVVGFVWTDAAMYDDNAITEPWLCLNALVVAPDFRGKGYGSRLLKQALASARAVGAVLVYGLSVPDSVSFWKAQGFVVAAAGEGLTTTAPARSSIRPPANYGFPARSLDRFFVKYLVQPTQVASGLLPTSQVR